jgi:hypothetical protein
MHPNLSFDQAPPFSVPLRFFLLAPWFGVAAGILFALEGSDALVSRWTNAALTLTHLLTAGFMLQAMAGALFQFIPVATGANVWRPGLVASVAQPLLVAGLVLLCAGFIRHDSALFRIAVPLLVTGGGVLAAAWLLALWQTPGKGATLTALRFAVFGLVVTIGVGAALADGLARDLILPYATLTDIHMTWGLGAWALLLLAGASFYVVPMFQLTPPYPLWLTRLFAPAVLAVTLLGSLRVTLDQKPAMEFTQMLPGALLLLLAGLYAVTTLNLQSRRRRRVSDVTLQLFRYSMGAILSVVAVGGLALLPIDGSQLRLAPLFGVLVLAGVFVSAINGMLYKIVPFIIWLHLQRYGASLAQVKLVPNMGVMIPSGAMLGQARMHMSAVVLLVLAVWFPALSFVAGMVFAASCAWLGWNLIAAVRRYAGFRRRILAASLQITSVT